MKTRRNRWCIVLAAGDGTRLRSLTTDRHGITTPKQFCSLRGEASLLRMAMARARRLAPAERTLAVVAAAHERWWRAELRDLPADGVVVQPSNRGTAPGILLPLLEVMARDPEAVVTILPSDHFVADESALESAARRASSAVERSRAEVVLLGIAPDAAVSDYGWIVPETATSRRAIRKVVRFVEKPPAREAARLMDRGALWNSFVMVAGARELLALFERRLPRLTHALRVAAGGDGERRDAGAYRAAGTHRAPALSRLYEAIPASDFSRDVLSGSESRLRLVGVPPCGWTDLGTPERVAACLDRMRLPHPGLVRRRPSAPARATERIWSGMVMLGNAV